MSHNSRNKSGPTLDEAIAKGATHISVHCHQLECLRKANVEISGVKAPRNVPVNHLPWKCGSCKGINVSVGLVFPDQPPTMVPVFEVRSVKPQPRRKVRAG